jgi:polyhydroxybutyrate depolymerase
MPALLLLHGRSGEVPVMRQWLGFDELAQQNGFMVIYPQSHQGAWDFGVGVRERGHVGRRSIDHERYILDIVDEVDAVHPIDRSRLFIAGVSDGASMAVRLSCRKPAVFKGLISVAATIAYYAVDDCHEPAPLSALLIHGVEDTEMPWQGKTYRQYKVFLSLDESVQWWMDRNHCPTRSAESTDYHLFAGQVDQRRIANCADDTEVVVYRVNDGGHTWPSHDHPQKRTRGHVNRDIDATALIARWMTARRE